jgi:hypothetical protein
MSCGLMMLKSDLGVPATVYSDSDACGETFQTGPNTQVRTVRKRRTEGSATAAGQAGSKSVHRKRSLGGMSRADVRWGPRFSSTAPGRNPHPLLHQISPWAGRSGEDESRAEVRCVRENFSNRAQHAGADGEEAADGRKCDGGRASGPGSKSVHRKRSLGGMSRAEVRWGPRFSSTAPPSTPIPSSIRFPRGLSHAPCSDDSFKDRLKKLERQIFPGR